MPNINNGMFTTEIHENERDREKGFNATYVYKTKFDLKEYKVNKNSNELRLQTKIKQQNSWIIIDSGLLLKFQ